MHRETMSSVTPTTSSVLAAVFDDSEYAATLGRKLIRALQLGPKYYALDLPRYFLHRRRLGLPIADWKAFWNPAHSFRKGPWVKLPLPPGYEAALLQLHESGVRFSLPRNRLEALLGVWWSCHGAAGDAIECGAFRGATSLLIALLGKFNALNQRVLMLDTFSGMPAPSRYDLYRSGGEYAPPQGRLDVLHRQVETMGLVDRVEIYQGLFSDTFTRLRDRDLRFSFVHVDANIFRGTYEACAFTIPRVVSEGAVVFDDYNALCDLGARLAIDANLASRGVKPVPLAECSAYLVL